MAKLTTPELVEEDTGADEFNRPPVFARGDETATTGPRDLAETLGPPSEVVTERPPLPE